MAAEQTQKLDREVRAGYEATPWIHLSDDTYVAIRNAGGISKPAPIPEDVEVIEVKDAGVEGVLYRKKGGDAAAPLTIWFHGGGYIFGFPALHAGLYVQLVQGAGCSVLAVKYRLAPENPFPAANEDALAAWKWATTGGIAKYGLKPPKHRIALGGTSAGGGLAASTTIRIRDSGGDLVMPAGVLLNIPWLSEPTTVPDKTSQSTVKFDRIWSLKNCTYAYNAWYPTKAADPKGHAFAANAPSLAGLPPVQLSVAEHDILRDASIAFAQRLYDENENGAELHIWKGAYHGNTGSVPLAGISQAQDLQQVRFLKDVLSE